MWPGAVSPGVFAFSLVMCDFGLLVILREIVARRVVFARSFRPLFQHVVRKFVSLLGYGRIVSPFVFASVVGGI